MALSLKSVPGIGNKLYENLMAHYTDENTALTAIRSMESCEVGGISVNQALKFAQNLFTLEHKITLESVLRTPDAMQIYRDILDLMSKFMQTEYSAKKLELYFPLPPEKNDLLTKRLDYSESALQFVQQNMANGTWDSFLQHLSKLGIFRNDAIMPKIKSRAIITDDHRVEARLREAGLNDLVGIDVLDPEKMKDFEKVQKLFGQYAKSTDAVFLALTQISRYPDYPNFFELDSKGPFELSEIVPELMLGKFAHNFERIAAACAAFEILQGFEDSPGKAFFIEEALPKNLPFLKSALQAIDDQGNFRDMVSKKLDVLRKIADASSGIIAEAEANLNAQVRNLIEGSSLTLNGTQLLQILRSQNLASIHEYIPDDLESAINALLDKTKASLLKSLQVDAKEFSTIDDLFLPEFSYPVEFKGETIDLLTNYVKKRARLEEFALKKKVASKLESLIPEVQKLLKVLLELEFFTGLGRFFAEYSMQRPQLVEKPGVVLRKARNLLLKDADLSAIVPIDYNVGDIDDNGPHLNLLTGSNSGGKTTCELTLIQIVILAQMGFLVPAAASIHSFQEIYFFKKSSGQLSAGAFETTLLQFVSLATSDKLKLILADELEAITEPSAAARVIGSILLLLLENPNNFGVFITHIVELMLDAFGPVLRESIRVDGIEASGLDENLNLVVNRNPRLNYVAKSTPELILERLVRKSTGDEKKFFENVKKRFNGQKPIST